jgi:hypothetical protein
MEKKNESKNKRIFSIDGQIAIFKEIYQQLVESFKDSVKISNIEIVSVNIGEQIAKVFVAGYNMFDVKGDERFVIKSANEIMDFLENLFGVQDIRIIGSHTGAASKVIFVNKYNVGVEFETVEMLDKLCREGINFYFCGLGILEKGE